MSLSCVVLSSTKREIWHFHVVIVQKRQRNVQQSVRARAKLLFCQSKPFSFCPSRCRHCRSYLSFLNMTYHMPLNKRPGAYLNFS